MRRAVLAAVVLFAACAPARLRWEYTMPAGLEGSPMTARVRAGSCSGDDVRYEASFTDGDATGDGPRLPPGTYGLELEAQNAACEVVARGCEVITLPGGDVVRVDLVAITPVPGVCPGVDAGTRDAGTDDASVDAGRDDTGPIDAAPTDAPRVDAPGVDAGPADVECASSTDCPCTGDACTSGRCVPARAVSEVEAGTNHTCAIATGQLFCWGTSAIGEVGGGSFDSTFAVPTRIGALSDWTELSTLARTTCGVAGGTVRCWGSNVFGQGGADPVTRENLFAPTAVSLSLTPTRVTVGVHQSFALDAAGLLAGWGANDHAAAGAPGSDTRDPLPPTTLGATAWLDVSSGEFFACGVSAAASELSCWGGNFSGSLGRSGGCTDCGPLPVSDPTPGTAGPTWTRVELGLRHACAWDAAGALYCWGRGTGSSDGALGAGSPTADSAEPVRVAGIVASEASLSLHTCVVDRAGLLWCFGPNDTGQLGTGDLLPRSSPTRVARTGWSDVTTGVHHTCALDDEGALFCWGGGARFVLGTSDAGDRTSPTRICMP